MDMDMKKILTFALTFFYIFGIAGCASNGGMASSDGSSECDTVKTGVAGLLIGAAIGAAVNGEKGAAQGAAAGAVLGAGACIAMNYQSKQVKTAQAVNDEYKQKHSNSLPAAPKVNSYALSAPKQTVRGNKVTVNSSMTVVDGSAEPVNSIKEKLAIVSPNNDRHDLKTKDAQVSGAGQYANTFSFSTPSGMAEGKYKLVSEVYVNGKLAKTASSNLMVASNDGVTSIALLDNK